MAHVSLVVLLSCILNLPELLHCHSSLTLRMLQVIDRLIIEFKLIIGSCVCLLCPLICSRHSVLNFLKVALLLNASLLEFVHYNFEGILRCQDSPLFIGRRNSRWHLVESLLGWPLLCLFLGFLLSFFLSSNLTVPFTPASTSRASTFAAGSAAYAGSRLLKSRRQRVRILLESLQKLLIHFWLNNYHYYIINLFLT